MLNLRQIEVFRAVMIAKTVTGAAQILHVSQPGLSRMLKHTEDRLGIRLFDRVAGRLLPTREAETLFREVQHLYKYIEGLGHITQRLAEGQDSIFRLGASPSLAMHVVPVILRALKQRFPKLSLRFDVLGVGEIADYLVTQQGEYALTVFPVSHPNVTSQQIGAGKFVCVVPRDHSLAKQKIVAIRDLIGQPLISFGADTPHGLVVADLFKRAGVELKVSTCVRFAETACAFVRQQLGVALVDEFTARGIDAAYLKAIPLDLQGTLPMFLNRAHYAVRSAVSDEFEKLLLKSVQREFALPAAQKGASV